MDLLPGPSKALPSGSVSSRGPSCFTSHEWLRPLLGGLAATGLLAIVMAFQISLDQRHDARVDRIETLRVLPRGEVLRPALLGFHHVGADVLWLQIVQVLGSEVVTQQDYEWLFHALDVVTTLDPQYSYVYDAGGTILAELAHRVDWSNQLLEKGLKANPEVWRIPFVLGFNYFFHLHDYVKAAEYMGQAAKIPGRPLYVDTLAARLYVEGGSPMLALSYLESMIEETSDADLRNIYRTRYNEVLIARDLQVMDQAIERYRRVVGSLPQQLRDLVSKGILSVIPDEPFGGEYVFDHQSGEVRSSTHPERLKLYRPGDAPFPN